MFSSINFENYVPHIDFIYTALLMAWGGALIGVTVIAVPYVFRHISSRDEASELTTAILHRLDILIRVVVLSMLLVFICKKQLNYSYQYAEWATYVSVLHLFIFGKILSKRLHKMRARIETFDIPAGDKVDRKKFRRMHLVVRFLYGGQICGVILLLYLHAFGL